MLDQLHGAEAQLGKATELIGRLEKAVWTLKQIQGGGDRLARVKALQARVYAERMAA